MKSEARAECGEVVALIERVLMQEGFRLTRARHIIVTVMATLTHPFTTGELEQAVAIQDSSVGRASVYRTLAILEHQGLVEKLHQVGSEHYTLCLRRDHHHHVTCVECGRTQDFAVQDHLDIVATVEGLARQAGYVPQSHVLEVYGTCPDCQLNPNRGQDTGHPPHQAGRHPLGRRASAAGPEGGIDDGRAE